jgi:hypothetical protein
MRRQRVVRVGIAVVVGLGTWVITGWPVGGVAAGCAAFFLPSFFTVGRQMERRIVATPDSRTRERRLRARSGRGRRPRNQQISITTPTAARTPARGAIRV